MSMITVKNAAELAEHILLAKEQNRPITVHVDPDCRVIIAANGACYQQRLLKDYWRGIAGRWPIVSEALKLVAETEEE